MSDRRIVTRLRIVSRALSISISRDETKGKCQAFAVTRAVSLVVRVYRKRQTNYSIKLFTTRQSAALDENIIFLRSHYIVIKW